MITDEEFEFQQLELRQEREAANKDAGMRGLKMTRKETLEAILETLEDHCGCDMWNDCDDAAVKACKALIDEELSENLK